MTEHAIARIAITAKRFLLLFFSLRIRTVSFLLGRPRPNAGRETRHVEVQRPGLLGFREVRSPIELPCPAPGGSVKLTLGGCRYVGSAGAPRKGGYQMAERRVHARDLELRCNPATVGLRKAPRSQTVRGRRCAPCLRRLRAGPRRRPD